MCPIAAQCLPSAGSLQANASRSDGGMDRRQRLPFCFCFPPQRHISDTTAQVWMTALPPSPSRFSGGNSSLIWIRLCSFQSIGVPSVSRTRSGKRRRGSVSSPLLPPLLLRYIDQSLDRRRHPSRAANAALQDAARQPPSAAEPSANDRALSPMAMIRAIARSAHPSADSQHGSPS